MLNSLMFNVESFITNTVLVLKILGSWVHPGEYASSGMFHKITRRLYKYHYVFVNPLSSQIHSLMQN